MSSPANRTPFPPGPCPTAIRRDCGTGGIGTARGPGARLLRLTGLACLAAASAGGCVDRLPHLGGRTISHRYRGVPDNDLSATPDHAAPAPAPEAARVNPPPQTTHAREGRIDEEQAPARPPAPRVPDLVWAGDPAGDPAPGRDDSGADPFSDAGRVNVFGEIGGRPVTKAAATGDAGFQQHTFTDEGADGDVSVDPTGKWLLFASTRHSDRPDIYTQRVDGTSVIQLTSDAADDAYPCFSPDGKQIAFASTRAGPWQIYTMDTDGRNVVQVTNGAMQCIHPTFSPDGTRLAYSAIGSRSNQWELWTANLQTNEKRMIGYGLFPRWSPDKTVDRIAFQKARQRGSRWFSLWTLDLIEGEGRRMTEVAAGTNAAIVGPAWSADGKRLAFATIVEPAGAAPPGEVGRSGRRARAGGGAKPQAALPAGVTGRGRQDIWTVDADGGNRQRLTDGNGTNLSPWWAPDNRVYFVSDRGGNECVWSVHADPIHAPIVAGGAGEKVEKGTAAADPREAEH